MSMYSTQRQCRRIGGLLLLFRLVAGTERWLLWPMGIPSPGAMRERGRHAIAFVGRRHVDDADLLERFFRAVDP